jgi:hypothetical protein
MSLEEKLLESVRNLKAMGEQCTSLAMKVMEEFTREKETKKEEKRILTQVSGLSENQVFMFEGITYKKTSTRITAFAPSALSVRTGDEHRTGFMLIYLYLAQQLNPIVYYQNGDGLLYFHGDLLVIVNE